MTEVQDLGRRSHGPNQSIGQIGERLRRDRERDLGELDSIPADALLPGIEHPAVVLVGRQHFVSGPEIEAELSDLQRFARVSRDRQLLRVASKLPSQAPADCFDVGLQDLPHVVHGRLVRDVEVALEGFVDDPGARATAAVIEVDDRPVEGESLLDLAPIVLVVRQRRPLPCPRRPGPRLRVGACRRRETRPPPRRPPPWPRGETCVASA